MEVETLSNLVVQFSSEYGEVFHELVTQGVDAPLNRRPRADRLFRDPTFGYVAQNFDTYMKQLPAQERDQRRSGNALAFFNNDLRYMMCLILFFILVTDDEKKLILKRVLNRLPPGSSEAVLRQAITRLLAKRMVQKMRIRERRMYWFDLIRFEAVAGLQPRAQIVNTGGRRVVHQQQIEQDLRNFFHVEQGPQGQPQQVDLLKSSGLLFNENLNLDRTVRRRLQNRAQQGDPQRHIIDTVVRENINREGPLVNDPRLNTDFRREVANAERRQRRLRAKARENENETLDQIIQNSLLPGTLGAINFTSLRARARNAADFFRIVDSPAQFVTPVVADTIDAFDSFFDSLGDEETFENEEQDAIQEMKNQRHAFRSNRDADALKEASERFLAALGSRIVPAKKKVFRKIIKEIVGQPVVEELNARPGQGDEHVEKLRQIFDTLFDPYRNGPDPIPVPNDQTAPEILMNFQNAETIIRQYKDDRVTFEELEKVFTTLLNSVRKYALEGELSILQNLILEIENYDVPVHRTNWWMMLWSKMVEIVRPQGNVAAAAVGQQGNDQAADEVAAAVAFAAAAAAADQEGNTSGELMPVAGQQGNAPAPPPIDPLQSLLDNVLEVLRFTENANRIRERLKNLVIMNPMNDLYFTAQSSRRVIVLKDTKMRDIQVAQRDMSEAVLATHERLINSRKVRYDARPVARAIKQLGKLDMLVTTLIATLSVHNRDGSFSLRPDFSPQDPFLTSALMNTIEELRTNALPDLKAATSLLNVGLVRR